MPRLIQVIGLILFVLLVVLLWAGVVRPIEVDEVSTDKVYGIYIVHHGEYYLYQDSFKEVKKYVDEKGIKYEKTFGRYFQDSKTTPSELLTSWVGVIVEDPVAVEEPFALMELKPTESVYVNFRGHPFFAPFRVYPKMSAYMARRKYDLNVPVLEVYSDAGYGQMIIEVYREVKK